MPLLALSSVFPTAFRFEHAYECSITLIWWKSPINYRNRKNTFLSLTNPSELCSCFSINFCCENSFLLNMIPLYVEWVSRVPYFFVRIISAHRKTITSIHSIVKNISWSFLMNPISPHSVMGAPKGWKICFCFINIDLRVLRCLYSIDESAIFVCNYTFTSHDYLV